MRIFLSIILAAIFSDGCSRALYHPTADGAVKVDAALDATSADLTSSCKTTSSSNLPGVTINFVSPDCTFTLAQAAAGIRIPYQVKIESATTNVVPKPQDAGGCDIPDQSGLIL